MAKSNTKLNYMEEDDILSLSKGMKVKASIEIGDFIIDVDQNGLISGIEILNASENLHLPENQLKELQKASMHVAYKPNYVRINLILQFKQTEKEVTIPLTVDLGHGSIKTENSVFAAV